MNYETKVGKRKYRVVLPRNSWDTNFHFIDKYGNDKLVDLQDVINWKYEITQDETITGASINDAIDYANDMVENGITFYWKRG